MKLNDGLLHKLRADKNQKGVYEMVNLVNLISQELGIIKYHPTVGDCHCPRVSTVYHTDVFYRCFSILTV